MARTRSRLQHETNREFIPIVEVFINFFIKGLVMTLVMPNDDTDLGAMILWRMSRNRGIT